MGTRKQRRQKKTPGVTLCKPNPAMRIGWRLRFKDPDTRRTVYERVPADRKTQEARIALAAEKSEELARRKMELAAGAPRATGTELAAVIKRYFEDHSRLSERTREIYRNAADKLEAWAPGARVLSADDLTRAKLMALRAELIREPKRVAAKGKGRGERVASKTPRSPAAVNQELRALRTVLGYVRDLDLLPKLTHDDLRRALKRLELVQSRIEFLKPAECQQLIEAALRHDAETFTETRDEHKGKGRARIGTTPRYTPIAPFTLFVLLTGMRVGEAIDLSWNQVDLDALDYDGRKVGEIVLAGEAVKTRRGRTVDLAVSPALQRMLAALKESSGGKGRVFSALTLYEVQSAADRLKSSHDAPSVFTWQALRRSCGTFLTNAPGIFGAASAYRSARQLGHSVQVAEQHYLGVLRGIPPTARDLETAMGVGELADQVVASVAGSL